MCSVVTLWNIYKDWNYYVIHNDTNDTNITDNTYNTNGTKTLFSLIKPLITTEISGRDLELCFPLFLVAAEISEEILKETTLILQEMMVAKREEEFTENYDIALYDFVSQNTDQEYFKSVNTITGQFREFVSLNEDWLNTKWMGRALKRLGLIKQKRRVGNRGHEVILDVIKAQQKIKMFK